ncbi:DUF3667 domain-containing protein [Ekhidna sp.]
MKKRRKHSRCLNCEEPLGRKANYCPNCGQENTDNHVSIGMLFREFTSNFFSLDSRFVRTFKPFLFSPGKITNAFINGKRVQFANPIRWYLVISIFHFFFMAKVFSPTLQDKKDRVLSSNDSKVLTSVQFDSLMNLPDSIYAEEWPLSKPHRRLVDHLIDQTTLSSEQILDTIQMDTINTTNYFIVNQFVKIGQESKASFLSYILRQIPIIVFFILPVYAFLLKLFFWRKGLYIKHLIHSLHLHSLYFFLLGWVWLFSLFFEAFQETGLNIATLITFIYAIISFRKVYKIKMIWCVFRAICIGLIYTFALGVVLGTGILISLALI